MRKASLTINIWTDAEQDELPDDDVAEILAPHVEHIAGMCEDGYLAGEIADDRFSGWWSIKRDPE